MNRLEPTSLHPRSWSETHVFGTLVKDTIDNHWSPRMLSDYMTDRFGAKDYYTDGWVMKTTLPGLSIMVAPESKDGTFRAHWTDILCNDYRHEHAVRNAAQREAWNEWLYARGGDPMEMVDRSDDHATETAAAKLDTMEEEFLASNVLKRVHLRSPTPTVDAVHAATRELAGFLAEPIRVRDEARSLPIGMRFVPLDAEIILKLTALNHPMVPSAPPAAAHKARPQM